MNRIARTRRNPVWRGKELNSYVVAFIKRLQPDETKYVTSNFEDVTVTQHETLFISVKLIGGFINSYTLSQEGIAVRMLLVKHVI